MEECPCRYCTVDDGRDPECHGRCSRYKTWKANHDKKVREDRIKRQAQWSNRTGKWYKTPEGHWRNNKLTRGRK